MHLRLCDWFSSEWVVLAPQLVGTSFRDIVASLPEGRCLREYFEDSDSPDRPSSLVDLIDTRRVYDLVISAYDREFAHFEHLLTDLRAARANLYTFLDEFSISPEVEELVAGTGRLHVAYVAHARALKQVGRLFVRHFTLHAHLAELFGAGEILSEFWLGGEEAEHLLETLEGL